MVQYPKKSRVRWWADTLEVLQLWPEEAKQNIGADLARVENKETPLDFKPLGSTLRGVTELRDRQKHAWYRLLYYPQEAWIFVVHCFQKYGNEIPKRELDTAKSRIREIDGVLKEGENAKQKKN